MDIHCFFILVHLFNKSHTPLYHLLRWGIVKIYSWQLQLSNTPFCPFLVRTITKKYKITTIHKLVRWSESWWHSNWLPKWARWSYLPGNGPTGKSDLLGHMINPLLTKLVWSRWDTCQLSQIIQASHRYSTDLPLSHTGHQGSNPLTQNFQKFRSKTQWIGSVQPEKFWNNGSTFWGGPQFPAQTGWNFGWMDRAPNLPE